MTIPKNNKQYYQIIYVSNLNTKISLVEHWRGFVQIVNKNVISLVHVEIFLIDGLVREKIK